MPWEGCGLLPFWMLGCQHDAARHSVDMAPLTYEPPARMVRA